MHELCLVYSTPQLLRLVTGGCACDAGFKTAAGVGSDRGIEPRIEPRFVRDVAPGTRDHICVIKHVT
jgi:hypothetical protein